MADESPVEWLTGEVDELFGAGRVGFYELIWLLNGPDFELSEAEKKEVAWTVANNIVEAGQAKIYKLKWAKDGFEGPFSLSDAVETPESWPIAVEEENYYALVPIEDVEDLR